MVQQLTRGYTETRLFMDTPVTIELVAPHASDDELAARADRAYRWFAEVEQRCSRFDAASELRTISRTIGAPVNLSTLVFRALDVALHAARITGGAFDPTIGRDMERLGYDTNFRTGERIAPILADGARATYEDVVLDARAQTVTLLRPMALDLGAVAKGLAIDLAAGELVDLPGFVVNAGGDMRVAGLNADGDPWRIGIRHPRRSGELLASLSVTGAAVCTSGDYERPNPGGAGHHIIDPALRASARDTASVTVVAPTATVADALATAAFVLGPEAGMALLQQQGAEGLIVGRDLRVTMTPGMESYLVQ